MTQTEKKAYDKLKWNIRNTEEHRLAKNQRDREIYQLKKENGLILSKKKVKLIIAKPIKPIKVPRKLPMDKIKQQVKGFKTLKQDLSKLIPLFIPELKLTVYVKPGQDIELIRKKYLKL